MIFLKTVLTWGKSALPGLSNVTKYCWIGDFFYLWNEPGKKYALKVCNLTPLAKRSVKDKIHSYALVWIRQGVKIFSQTNFTDKFKCKNNKCTTFFPPWRALDGSKCKFRAQARAVKASLIKLGGRSNASSLLSGLRRRSLSQTCGCRRWPSTCPRRPCYATCCCSIACCGSCTWFRPPSPRKSSSNGAKRVPWPRTPGSSMKIGAWLSPPWLSWKLHRNTCGRPWVRRLSWGWEPRIHLWSPWRKRERQSARFWKVRLCAVLPPLAALRTAVAEIVAVRREQTAGAEFRKLLLTPVYVQTWGVQATRQGFQRRRRFSGGLRRGGAFNRSVTAAAAAKPPPVGVTSRGLFTRFFNSTTVPLSPEL